MDKPLPKSLHTVKVLKLVAKHNAKVHDVTFEVAMEMALNTLGLNDVPDSYGLIKIAIKQLEATRK